MMKLCFFILTFLFALSCKSPEESSPSKQHKKNVSDSSLKLTSQECADSISKGILEKAGQLPAPKVSFEKRSLDIDAFFVETTKISPHHEFQVNRVIFDAKNQNNIEFLKFRVCSSSNCFPNDSEYYELKTTNITPVLNQFDNQNVQFHLKGCRDDITSGTSICGKDLQYSLVWSTKAGQVVSSSRLFSSFYEQNKNIEKLSDQIWKESCVLVKNQPKSSNPTEEIYLRAATNICFSSSAYLASILSRDYSYFSKSQKTADIDIADNCWRKYQSGLNLAESNLPRELEIGLPVLSVGLSTFIFGQFYQAEGWRGVASFAGFEAGIRLGSRAGFALGDSLDLGWGRWITGFAGGFAGGIAGETFGRWVGKPLYKWQFNRTAKRLNKKEVVLADASIERSKLTPDQIEIIEEMAKNNAKVGKPVKWIGGSAAAVGLILTVGGLIQHFTLTEGDTNVLHKYRMFLAEKDRTLARLIKDRDRAYESFIQIFDPSFKIDI